MTPIDRPHRDPASVERQLRRRHGAGRLAGLLLLGAAGVAALTRALPPAEPGRALDSPLLAAFAVGVVCLLAPWRRLAPGVLHLVPLAATTILVAGIAGAGSEGSVYASLYFVLAAYVGYAFPSRRAVCAHMALIGSCAAAPLYAADALERVVGMIPAPEPVAETVLRTFALGATAALMAVVRERLETGQDALRELTQSDPLTGVGNYRKLYGCLAYEIRRHQRSGQQFALLVLDLDGFKAVNDRNGHLAGDRLLQEVGRVLSRTVRAQDTVARQGGDEFAVLAPETGSRAAEVLAERIEHALAGIDSDLPVGVSVGWAVYPEDGEERMVLVERADARQRAVKRARRASLPERGATRLSA